VKFSHKISSAEELEEVMTIPPPPLVELMQRLGGDIMILGIAGKMGVTLGREALRACRQGGVGKQVVGVSRFSDTAARDRLDELGVKTITCDLLDPDAVQALPEVRNIIYMAGKKFGTQDSEALTWAMNTIVPSNVARRFRESRIVVFSTGNVYPFVAVDSGGCTETAPTDPVGDYAQSCLGRERVFTYYSQINKTPMVLFRLNYATDLRYGVLYDIGSKVVADEPVPLATGYANVIWQGDANTQALLALDFCASPPEILNVTGPETISIREVAGQFGVLFGKTPHFDGEETGSALLSNAGKAAGLFGRPRVGLEQMIEWTAHWIQIGGPSLGKPTHFEARDGNF